MRVGEAHVMKKLPKSLVPCMRSLLEAIDYFIEFTYMRRMIFINKSWWLSHEDILDKMALEKGVVYIKLLERPVSSKCRA